MQDMEVSDLHDHDIHVFHAVVGSVGDDGMIQVRMVKNEKLLHRNIHPRQIIQIRNQSMTF